MCWWPYKILPLRITSGAQLTNRSVCCSSLCCSSLCCRCAMLNSQANCNKEAMCPLHERSMMVGGAHAREEFAKVPTGQLGGLPTINWAATVEVHPCCSCFSSQLPCCNALINLLCGYLYTCHKHRDTSKSMFVSIPGCLSGETRGLCQACSIACASKDSICSSFQK